MGEDPIMESRIRLGASYSIPYMGTAAAAAMIWKMRTGRGQDLKIDLRKAIHYIADMPWSTLNGRTYPHPYTQGCALMEENYLTKDGRRFSPIGFYPDMERAWCSFLDCAPTKESIAAKIAEWNALDLETACNARGLVGGMVRTVEEWANTECGQQLAQTPVIEITKIGDSKPEPFAPGATRPLSGLRVVSNTHEIAGTAVGRTLAEQGAEVLQTSAPDEFFHDHILLEAGVGMRQAYVDIKKPAELAGDVQPPEGCRCFRGELSPHGRARSFTRNSGRKTSRNRLRVGAWHNPSWGLGWSVEPSIPWRSR